MTEDNVIVAVRDMEHVDDLVKLGCQMARGMRCHLIVLHVVEIPPALPLEAHDEVFDAPARQILSRASRVASETCGEKVSTHVVRSRYAGEAIANEARNHSAQLVILGYRHKARFQEILLGSTVQHLAENAPCRLIVSIIPAPRADKA